MTKSQDKNEQYSTATINMVDKKSLTLKTKLILFTLVIVISLSVSLVGFFYIISKKEMKQNLAQWADSYADNFAFYIKDIVSQKDVEKIEKYLLTARNDSRILYAVVLNEFGMPIAKYDPGEIYQETYVDKKDVQTNEIQRIRSEKGFAYYRIVRTIQINGSDNKATPGSDADAQNGFLKDPVLFMGISSFSMDRHMFSWIKNASLIVGALLLVFVTLGIIYVERTSLPLKQLVKGTQAIAEGQWDYHVKARTGDEIGILAQSFNSMTTQLADTRQKLKSYADNLEKMVEKRTMDLRQSELKYRTLFEHSGTALALVDSENSLTMVNQRFEMLCGLSSDQIVGAKKFTDFFETEDAQKLADYFRQSRSLITQSEAVNYECVFINHQNERRRVNINFSILTNTDMLLVNIIDVTQLRELQQQLDRAQHLIEVGEMSASLAHEIRNPLGAIHASIDIITQYTELDGDEKRLLNIINEETMRINKIITDFLQFARIQKSQLEQVNINELLESELDKVHENYGEKYTLEKSFCETLPEMEADANQLKYVFSNILENAVGFMPKGGEITAETTLVKDVLNGKNVIIKISDNGPGIEQSKLTKIFQPFYTTKEKGIGMGLAISERIIQNHNGMIKASSENRHGTTLTISLPA